MNQMDSELQTIGEEMFELFHRVPDEHKTRFLVSFIAALLQGDDQHKSACATGELFINVVRAQLSIERAENRKH